MSKLKLELEELAVDSFATADDAGPEAGTVEGQEMRTELTCAQTTPYCKTILTYCPCTPRWEEPL